MATTASKPTTTALSKFVWGDDRLQRRCEILDAMSGNPIFVKTQNPYELSRKQLWKLRVQQGIELLSLKFKLGWSNQQYVEATKIAGDVLSMGVNYRSEPSLPHLLI